MTSQSTLHGLETQLIMPEVVYADFSIFLFPLYQIICQHLVFNIFDPFLQTTFMNDLLSCLEGFPLWFALFAFKDSDVQNSGIRGTPSSN